MPAEAPQGNHAPKIHIPSVSSAGLPLHIGASTEYTHALAMGYWKPCHLRLVVLN